LFLWPGTKFTEGLSNSSDKQKTKIAIAEGLSNCRLEKKKKKKKKFSTLAQSQELPIFFSFTPKIKYSGLFSWVKSEISYLFVGFMPI
jgi:hypothetical protein